MVTIALAFACVLLLALAAPSRASEMSQPDDTLSMSTWSSCAIKPDGTLSCWGKDVNFAFNMPAGHYSQVSDGGDHVCAIKDDGTLVCTGNLGTPPSGTFRTVESQAGAACAIRTDSTVACWGSNGSGETTAPTGTFIDVAMNNATSCGVKTDGTLDCWGYGTPTNPVSGGNTTAMVPPSGTYVSVSVGNGRACAIKPDGTLACWGSADATTTDSFKAIAMGDDYKCGIKVNGLLACWGYLYPWVDPPSGQFTQIVSSGGDSMCALKSDGTLACWGSDDWDTLGRLEPPAGNFLQPLVAVGSTFSCLVRGGDGSTLCLGSGIGAPPVGTATQITAGATYVCTLTATAFASCSGNYPTGLTGIPGDLGSVLQLSAGTRHSCALKPDRTVRCWGDDSFGEVSDVPSGATFRSISSGGDFSCGVKTDGALACWGWNPAPGFLTPPAGSFLSVSAGTSNACAVRIDGVSVCWGPRFVVVPQPTGAYVRTTSGDPFDCGLTATRTLSCWGGAPNGELAAPSGQFVDVASGANTSCAIRAERTIACWGSNANGQSNSTAFTSSSVSTTVGGQSYSHAFTAESSIAGTTVSYSLAAGSTLPPGLTLAPDGSLTGTPTAGGNYTFTVLAGDGVYDPAQQQNTINVDLTPPAVPTGLATNPAGLGNATTIRITGNTEPAATVRIYNRPGCVGSIQAQGSSEQFSPSGPGVRGLAVTVSANWATALYANATDAYGNTSGCAGPVTYTNDSVKPAPPELEATPSSPSTATALTITGSGEAGSTYRLFDGAECAGIAIGLGPISTLTSGIAKTVQQNSTNVYTATLTDAAGNSSNCSAPLTFVSDQIAPEPAGSPTPIATGASTTPSITGNAEAGSTVELYLTSDCSGTPVASGSAAEFASPGLPVNVSAGIATSIYATVTDGAGQSSACLLLTVYTQVTPASPAGPSPTAPAGALPAKIAKPKLRSRTKRGRLSVAGTARVSAAGITAAQCSGKLKTAVTLKVRKKTKRLASKSFALRFANGKCQANVSLKLKAAYKGKKPTFTISLTGASALSAKQISFKQKI